MKADKTTTTTELSFNLDIALKFGLVVEKTRNRHTWYVLGPNLQFTLPTTTYTNETQPDNSDPSHREQYKWNGEHSIGIKPNDLFLSSNSANRPFKITSGDK